MTRLLRNLFVLCILLLISLSGYPDTGDIFITPGWHKLKNTKLRSVCPPKGFGGIDYNFRFYCQNVTKAWNGGAFDSKRNRLYIWGGGHNDYYGNEIYSLDLKQQRMTRLTDPVIPIARRKKGVVDQELTPFDGTQPNSRHTYDGLVYMPHVDKMWAFSGSLSSSTGNADNLTWIFDPANNQWKKAQPKGTIPKGALGIVSAYDPVTKLIYLHNRKQGLFSYQYTPEGGIYTQLNSDSGIGIHTNAVIDPKRRKFIIIGRKYEYIYDIGSGSKYRQEKLNTKGDKDIVNFQAPGLAYDPIADKILGWSGSNKVYTLNLDNLTWEATAFPNGPNRQHGQGTYGRWQYAPDLDVFVLYNSVDEDAFIFRPIRGKAGTIPPSVPTNLEVTAVFPYKVELSWARSKDPIGILRYLVYRNGVLLASVLQPKFSDLLVSSGNRYLYSVRAVSFSKLASEKSTPLSVEIPASRPIRPMGDCSNEPLLINRKDVVFCEPWEDEGWWKKGYLNDPIIGDPRKAKEQDKRGSQIVSANCISGKCLKVPTKKGQTTSLSLYWPLANAQLAPEQIFLRYYLRIGSEWSPYMCNKDGTRYGQGGKFPGPADPRTWADPAGQCGNGGNRSNGIDCWSMRAGFHGCGSGTCITKPRAVTRFGSYLYHPGQEAGTGDSGWWDSARRGQSTGQGGSCETAPDNLYCGIGDGGILQAEQWYRIEMQVTMNTPGEDNGIIRGWIDGVLSYEKTNMVFRLPGHDNLHNRLIWLNVYKGGTKGNCNDSEIYLDQMVIATDAPAGGIDSTTPVPPKIRFFNSPDSEELLWHTSGAESCTASGDWSGNKPLFGSEPISPIPSNGMYTLTCANHLATLSKSVRIRKGRSEPVSPAKQRKATRSTTIDKKGKKAANANKREKTPQDAAKITPRTHVNAWSLSADFLPEKVIRLSWTDLDIGKEDSYIIHINDREISKSKHNYFFHENVNPGATYRYNIEITRKQESKTDAFPSLTVTAGDSDAASMNRTRVSLSSPMADTFLSRSTHLSLGKKARLDVSKTRNTLIKFNMPKLNPGEYIVSARLRLYDYAEYGTLDAVGVYRAGKDWLEGATRRYFDFYQQREWSSPLGDWLDASNQLQGDHPYAEKRLIDDDKPKWVEWDVTKLVEEWVSGEHPNHGLLLRNRSGGDAHIFRSREYSNPEFRPQLIIMTSKTGAKKH